jgi:cytochrome c oxidase subunit 2
MTENKRIGWASVLAGLAAFAAPVAAFAAEGAAKYPDPAADWNHLFKHVLADIIVIGVVFGLAAVYMLWKYRAKTPGQVGQGPKLSVVQAVGLAVIPAVVFMADDFYLAANGWVLFNTQRSVPAGALEVRVTAQQFFWDFDYGNGVTASNELTVPVGRPVVLRMTASDVVHSFGLPDFRIKEDAVPGRKTYLWFIAEAPGTHVINCGEYCGMGHAMMLGTVKAVPPVEFDAWVKSQTKS